MQSTRTTSPSLQHPSPDTQYPAKRSTGGDATLWVAVVLAILCLAALGVSATRDPGLTMLLWAIGGLVLGGAAFGVGLWSLTYRRLAYALAPGQLEIAWFGYRLGVPYTAIDGVYTGQRLVGNTTPTGLSWPGIYVGSGRARGVGRLRFFTTSPDPSALTLIMLERSGVVLSARNPHDFRTALIERIQDSNDAEASTSLTSEAPATSPWTAIFDRWLPITVALGLVVFLAILAAIGFGFEALSLDIPIRFDASGDPTQIAPRADLVRLPFLGLLLLLVNAGLGLWLHAREPLLARLGWVSGAVIQAVLLVAVVRLLQ